MIRVATTATHKYNASIQLGFTLVGLILTSLYSYLLFHTLAEIIVVIIAAVVFFIIWNTRSYLSDGFFIIIGPAYLFIGIFTLLHALAYKGMNIFPPFNDPNLATQLWLVVRYLTAISFLIASFFVGKKIKINLVFYAYLILSFFLVLVIFPWDIFPPAYVAGVGLTALKKYSEYFISLIFIGAVAVLYLNKEQFDRHVWKLLTWALVLSIISEFIFTLYFSVYDYVNLTGHLVAISGSYLIYLAIVENSLTKPYRLLYQSFKLEQEALYKSEERFRMAVDNYPAIFIIYDADKKIKYVNSKGIKDDKINEQVYLSEIYRSNLPVLERVIIEKIKQYQECEVETTDGKRYFTMTYVPILDKAGKIKEIIGIGNDVTRYVKSEENLKFYAQDLEKMTSNLERFQLALECAGEHIVITDVKGVIVYANKEAEELTGYSKAEMMGQTPFLWEQGLAKNYQSAEGFFEELIGKIRTSKYCFFGEVPNKRKNGQSYVTDLHISPVIDNSGEINFFILIERDITELKEIDRAKSEFISLASHQLRTPLTSISLSSELLLRGIGGKVESEQKKYLEEIFVSTQRMAELIDDLLSVTKIEMGSFQVRPQEIDLIGFVEKCLDELKLQIDKKELALVKNYDPGASLIMNFDKTVLRMTIENLVSNAIQYTESGGSITVSLEKNDDGILIKVADTGFGVAEDELEKIFDKLFRSRKAQETNLGGSGLGLYIVKSFINKAGAKIWVESEEGQGTTFSIRIPV